jgi:PTH1 family peptidyl-tRNA hydrolase
MKLLVGLGNPGSKYLQTRHNVGFLFIDYLVKNKLLNKQFRTLKPDTFMNNSGLAVSKELNFYKLLPADLIVVHDDLDLRLGEFKMQLGKGPHLHNGVESVEKSVGTKEFWRVRVGVDNRDLENRVSGQSYVLQNFTTEELDMLHKQVFPKIKL